ncbi:AlpA family phage regulatory protein [Klebsiella grimontii]|uniref:helix-turn-helix transcriptional regulator n=1 Tax=Klebsiella grimontii TaxID=2058152 RepID=UPI000E341714|nr:AlpA family phage regulatory protein [Klebsiella grimontii]RFP41654.1 transcriptional regulator [Klebsiella oxytoca]MBZ6971718.1 AlpA family phage regulatory protein [Klebsiella grimontii]MBZ7826287.1 AlpA family phage regulatory protein [Klebsiella grimontii]MDM4405838.1 AlpA family phage regulatory protein [Klebsiella grimontii]QTP39135.1 AlpA family phage regulatory protein [Klebsiella grimontii]
MTSYKLIDLKTVLDIYPVSRATLYRQIKSGVFPEPIQIGARRVAWRLEEVQAYISELQKVKLMQR